MIKHFFWSIAFLAISSCAATSQNLSQALRLDATSDVTAQKSFDKMLDQSSAKKQQDLTIAMVKLNMVGVKSAHEVVENPALQKPTIARVKDRVAGMTADEIIDFANRTSDVKVEVKRK